MSDVRKGHITVDYTIDGDTVTVKVDDTGDISGLEGIAILHVAIDTIMNGDNDE